MHPRDRRDSRRTSAITASVDGDHAAARVVGACTGTRRRCAAARAGTRAARRSRAAHRALGLDRQRGRVRLVAVAAARARSRPSAVRWCAIQRQRRRAGAPSRRETPAARSARIAIAVEETSSRGPPRVEQDVPAAAAAGAAQEADRAPAGTRSRSAWMASSASPGRSVAPVAPARCSRGPSRSRRSRLAGAAGAAAARGSQAEDQLRRLAGAGARTSARRARSALARLRAPAAAGRRPAARSATSVSARGAAAARVHVGGQPARAGAVALERFDADAGSAARATDGEEQGHGATSRSSGPPTGSR